MMITLTLDCTVGEEHLPTAGGERQQDVLCDQ